MHRYLIILMLWASGHVSVLYATMTLFNARDDVEYYQFGVFDAEWNKVPFAMQNKIMRFKHLEKKKVDIYIREKDSKDAVYICSKSKLLVDGGSKTSIISRICSKIK